VGRSLLSDAFDFVLSSPFHLAYSLDRIFLLWNTYAMAWDVEFTDEFHEWWNSLDEPEQEDIAASVILLRERGPTLGRPHVDLVTTSAHPNMKELRTQHDGRPYRTLLLSIRGGLRSC
jgi:Phage derived protein Gp49-like (DUF891)